MKKNIALLSCIITLFSCTNVAKTQEDKVLHTNEAHNEIVDEHSSQNSLDWAGIYMGITPCADCTGINTSIILKENNTFVYHSEYMERNVQIKDTGTFMWHDNGSIIHLKSSTLDTKYKVGENVLFQLDTEGKMMEGPLAESFQLKKVK